ncbi:hypothetical protein ACRE_082570 [Hapsidospora chrysogenum ATCC 11550]|uniref:Thiaminase-2/PQQC domain-containing protein n=1 Tax=Hapsidospora chrysogenum (strain ATCC 11550 / CBS 779.69 / DSM 880 / IAM 14645 / JCM 23072 / IMI 49137) TaxID=857340 RepID=A0A086SV98_HAPC1|nr:hypothetical protein ACRE_082570 [Hapsidospora chrysogenum ATCC 11550]
MAHQSLTKQLLESDKDGFQRATQSPFLAAAARGKVSRTVLGEWLANDRMYLHSYISGAGRILATHHLPVNSALASASGVVSFIDWLIEGIANVRREERLFIDTAARYGIGVDLPTSPDGTVADGAKLEGLRRFEKIFASRGETPHKGDILPWLEDAVVYWATEKCYLDAWSWAGKQAAGAGGDITADEDGGALRTEFIPNWSSQEFFDFVDRLGVIIDDAVNEMVKAGGDQVRSELVSRAQGKWKDVLAAEEAFWPKM